mmetsp:Transcript_14613/g.49895  ORF Transcript_14613/g.49895 Transcript_14613/m.49895 type:complete len:333 (-) Transcript_14613:55-1053(-)
MNTRTSLAVILLALCFHGSLCFLPAGFAGFQRHACRSSSMRSAAARRVTIMSDKEDFLNRDIGGFTQKQRFREEIESPFRKIRLFLFPAAAASAALGAFIAGTRLLAISTGVTGYDFDQTLQNFGIDVLGATGFALLYWNDLNARDRDLVRIARSGKLSTLTLKIVSETGREASLPMKAFRKQRRIAIIAGGKDVVQVAREMARAGAEDLTKVGAIVLPLQLDQVGELDPAEVEGLRRAVGVPEAAEGKEEADSESLLPCLAAPLFVEKWKDWIQDEQKRAVDQGLDLKNGITIYVERSGYIKKRSAGIPSWRTLAEDTKARNRPYGLLLVA